MKKFIYCLLPLIALQLNSCAPTKYFSREALPEEPNKDLTVVTGFKNRTTYRDGLLYDFTSATYDKNKNPVTLNSLIGSKKGQGLFMNSNDIAEYKYNKDGLLERVSLTSYSIEGNFSEIKKQQVNEYEYDKYKNETKDTETHIDYDEEGEIKSKSVTVYQTSYTYDKNGNLISCVDERINKSEEGEKTDFKKTREYKYDKKQRLIEVEAKLWGDGDYDNPEGYTQLFKESHTYEGRKITDINESFVRTDEGTFKATGKVTNICEYDSKYNLTHQLTYDYNLDKPVESSTTEEFYEYNSKGLETCFKCYVTNGLEKAISSFKYRITTYCGTNNDKIESQINMEVQVAKFSDSNAEKSKFKNIRNYYDSKQRVVKQEIEDDTKKGTPTQTTYLFEY